MDILSKLQSLGFRVDALPDLSRENAMVYRIRTAKGWVYERLDTVEQVDAWAVNHKPERN